MYGTFTGFHRCFTEDDKYDKEDPQKFKAGTTSTAAAPSTTPAPADTSSSNVGVIVGGAVGGVVLVVLIGIGIFFGTQKAQPKAPPPQPVVKMAYRARLNIPPNATLLYSDIPQQLYPVYPLQHIRVLRQ